MKKSILALLILASILSACQSAPQVTVTSEVTVTLPPTETPIPTPTLNPQFISIQEQIAQSGYFTLLPDGTIEERTSDGGYRLVSGIIVNESGTIFLEVDNEKIEIDLEDVTFNENGLKIKGFVKNEIGEWRRIEKPLKEISLCESAYDVLTLKNDLNPEYLIDMKDLQAVANWIQTQLTNDMFDPSKLKLLSDVGMRTIYGAKGQVLIPETNTAPNYLDPASAPFIKDNPWCGYTEIEGLPYMVVFVPYFIKDTPPNEWPVLIGVHEYSVDLKGVRPITIKYYAERMNVIPWYTDESSISIASKFLDPLTGENFTFERLREILAEMEVGNFTNVHSIVLRFNVADSWGGWYE